MAILMPCACGKKLRVKDELAGKRIKCPACDTILNVPAPAEEVPGLEDFDPAAEGVISRSTKEQQAPRPKASPFFWSDPHALGGKIFALSDYAFFVHDLDEKGFKCAQADLEQGTRVEEALEGAKTVIPYAAMRKVESNLHHGFIDFTWKEEGADKDTETNVLCPSKDSRDEIVEGLHERLPNCKRQVIEYSRLKASWQPLLVIVIFGFITFCMVMAALHPEEGDGKTKVVRTNWIGAVFVWVFNIFGPVGVALLGTPFVLGGVAWLAMRMLKPPLMLTLTPREAQAKGHPIPTARDRSKGGGRCG